MLSVEKLKATIVAKLTAVVSRVQAHTGLLLGVDIGQHVYDNMQHSSGTLYTTHNGLAICWQVADEPTEEHPIIAWICADEEEELESATAKTLKNILSEAKILAE